MFQINFSKIIGISIKAIQASRLDKFKLPELLCGNCPAYNKRWACPPFSFSANEIIADKKFANLVAIKIKPTQKNLLPRIIIDEARIFFDALFYDIEALYKGSILLLAGSCICEQSENCPKQKNLPCVQKDKMRYSLEALGYDVTKISEELLNTKILWQTDVQPEYFTLVYCICSDFDISDEIKISFQSILQ
ncbi:MAG: hypothetical protein E7035_04700 [Verrucomicrobiaceae bacterium]|nr:hypothetical protein [Verrucomicrobiaceae bacterium]